MQSFENLHFLYIYILCKNNRYNFRFLIVFVPVLLSALYTKKTIIVGKKKFENLNFKQLLRNLSI